MYFNRADVREALHVAPTQTAGFWLGVNPQVSQAYTYNVLSVIPQHKFLISRGEASVLSAGTLFELSPVMINHVLPKRVSVAHLSASL